MIDFPLFDPLGRELVLLIRRIQYERYLGSQIDVLLDREFSRVVDIMVSGKYRSLTAYQKQRAAQLFRELDTRIQASYGDLTTLHLDAMRSYAQVEAEVAREIVTSILGASDVTIPGFGPFLPRNYIASIAKLPIQGLKIGEWFDAQARTMSLETKRVIQQGLIEGKTITQLASAIDATDKAKGPAVVRRAKRDAKTISRTIVNAVQNDAQFASISDLPASVSDSYVYESVLDNRTCFEAKTLVKAGAEFVRIDSIRPGQCVTGGSGAARRVVATTKARTRQVATVTLSNGEVLRCTPDHLFLTKAGLWIEAQLLTPGEGLAQPGDQAKLASSA